MFVDCFIIFLHCIPFIDSDNDAFASFVGDSGNFCILFSHTFCSINNDNNHIGTFYCRYRTDNAVTLNFFFDLVLSAQTCGINENIFSAMVFYFCINGISGRSRNIRYNDAVLSGQFINDRRFSYVRFSNNSYLRTIISSISPRPNFPDAAIGIGSPMPRL